MRRTTCVLLCLVLSGISCKKKSESSAKSSMEDTSKPSLVSCIPPEVDWREEDSDELALATANHCHIRIAMIAADGESDHGEIDRAIDQQMRSCMSSRQLGCSLVVPQHRAYDTIAGKCKDARPAERCQVFRFADAPGLYQLLKEIAPTHPAAVLVAHHTSNDDTLWDGYVLRDIAKAFPGKIVVRTCFSPTACTSSQCDNVIPAGPDKILEFQNLTWKTKINQVVRELCRNREP